MVGVGRRARGRQGVVLRQVRGVGVAVAVLEVALDALVVRQLVFLVLGVVLDVHVDVDVHVVLVLFFPGRVAVRTIAIRLALSLVLFPGVAPPLLLGHGLAFFPLGGRLSGGVRHRVSEEELALPAVLLLAVNRPLGQVALGGAPQQRHRVDHAVVGPQFDGDPGVLPRDGLAVLADEEVGVEHVLLAAGVVAD
jgi:hypothetical protein